MRVNAGIFVLHSQNHDSELTTAMQRHISDAWHFCTSVMNTQLQLSAPREVCSYEVSLPHTLQHEEHTLSVQLLTRADRMTEVMGNDV